MSTSIDYSKLSVAQLLASRTAIDEAIMARSGGVAATTSAAGGKAAKVKAVKVKRKGVAGAWSDWTKKVMTENDAEIKAFKEAAEKKCGAHLKWISANKGKESAEWLAFKADWDASHPKGAKGAKEVSEDEESEEAEAEEAEAAGFVAAEKAPKRRGPKRLADMTPEEKAKHDAGVAERKAKKSAGAMALEAEAKASVSIQPLAVEAQVPNLVVAPVTEVTEVNVGMNDEEEDGIELKIFTLDGQKYMRPWSSGAKDWATGDLWYTNKKGEKSHYLGELMDDGSINCDADEPELN